MQRVYRLALLLCVPILAVLMATAGCSKGKDEQAGSDGGKDAKEGPKKAGEAEAFPAKEFKGVVVGKVTYDGDPPKLEDLKAAMEKQGDKEQCLMGPTANPKWVVGADKGVANVVVWLRPVNKNQYFKLPAELTKRKDLVTIDQPHCAFEPHVVVVFPSFYDAKDKRQEKTGQTFKVLNSAKINHNTKWAGEDNTLNPGANPTLTPGKDLVIDAKPCGTKKFNGAQLITLNCNIHTWMTGYAYAFDHPFAAVSKADGTYKIENAPTGAELEIVYWHEDLGSPKVLKKVTLKDGDNTEDIKVKK